MRHLKSEELSAHLDRALTGRAAEAAERHLADCASCREALAALASQDASLRGVLTHEPDEAYFADFAGRVEERIRSAEAAPARPGSGFDLTRLFGSPRALAWAGTAAVIVAGAGLALMSGREVRPPDLRDRDLVERAQRAESNEAREREAKAPAPGMTGSAVTPAEVATRAEEGAAGSLAGDGVGARQEAGAAPGAKAADEEQAESDRADASLRVADDKASADRLTTPTRTRSQAPGAPAPGRAVEVRRNAAGEDVPVWRSDAPAVRPPSTSTAPMSASEQARKKLAAEPLGKQEVAARSLKEGFAAEPVREKLVAGSSPAVSQLAAPAPMSTAPAGAATALASREVRLCGEVRDAAGRPVTGAQVSVADVGRTATTDARGAFCLEAPAGEHPLSVMAVGFDESRRTVRVGGDAAMLQVTLQAVPVMEARRDAASGRVPLPRVLAGPSREPRDAYAALPDSLRSLVGAAQQLDSSAAARGSARLFDAAASGWERTLRRLEGHPLEVETRWRLAQARFHAWEAGPNDRRVEAAVEALTAYALRAPAGAEREQAIRWLDQVRR